MSTTRRVVACFAALLVAAGLAGALLPLRPHPRELPVLPGGVHPIPCKDRPPRALAMGQDLLRSGDLYGAFLACDAAQKELGGDFGALPLREPGLDPQDRFTRQDDRLAVCAQMCVGQALSALEFQKRAGGAK